MNIKSTYTPIVIISVIIVALLGWSYVSQVNDPSIITTNGLHWHANISITVRGNNVVIPANIGISSTEMRSMHTHKTNGIIHMEFRGTVHKKDMMLKQFFKIWGKDMNSFGTNMQMTVNGKKNTQYGQYEVQDGDVIKLSYD